MRRMLLSMGGRVIFVAALLQVVIGVSQVLSRIPLIDYTVYYEAARTTMAGENPYTRSYGKNILFNYPPSSLLFFLPFALVPQPYSQFIFSLLSLMALLLSIHLLLRRVLPPLPWSIRLMVLAVSVQLFPSKFTLVMGQVNLFVLLFLVLAFLADEQKQPYRSAVWWAGATMIKVTPIGLGLYFLLRRQWTTLSIGMIMMVVTNSGFLLFLPTEQNFFSSALPALVVQTATTTAIYDQSLRAFVARLGFVPTSPLISIGVILVLVALGSYWYLQKNSSQDNQKHGMTNLTFFSLLLTLITIGNSYAWHHHFVFLYPGIVTIFLSLRSNWSRWIAGLSCLSIGLMGYHFPDPAHPPTTNPFLLSHAVIGAMIIGMLLLYLLSPKHHRSSPE